MEFDFNEKLAVLKITTDVIKADGTLHQGEMKFLEELKKDLGFDIPTIEAAEDLDRDTALVSLHKLTYDKKKALVEILRNVAVSDNLLHEKEMDLIISTFTSMGLGEELE
ncbi:hypothetical protein [Maribacter sp. 2308TA10-17]|uniref:hypothetical protein n=1 Tax=Maribacter sp. 2308TA10-17 TaxID=3386276 RepID=UPI0039BC9560